MEGDVARHLLTRTRYALTALNPADNPYLQWILLGRHTTALPCALRPDCFAAIRANLDRLEWRCCGLEDWLASHEGLKIDRYNLSDIFEYMSAGVPAVTKAPGVRRQTGWPPCVLESVGRTASARRPCRPAGTR